MSIIELQNLGGFNRSAGTKRLRFGQLFHVRAIAILGRTNRHGRLRQTRADHHFTDTCAIHVFEPRFQVFKLVFLLLEKVLHFLSINLGAILVDGLKLEIVIVGQIEILVEIVHKIQHFPVASTQSLHKWRRLHLFNRRTTNIINVLLSRLHARHILRQRDWNVGRLGARESQQLHQSFIVALILQNTQLDRFAKLAPKLNVLTIGRG
mmetsp:Transcript_35338/g.57837  ORF Transcript_35338/g.57837 Transcript_35338/m.57837 type:complete len:208 (-) Transcript_35338:1180-1803(-)